LYRDINNFKKSCQPRSNIVKDEKGDLFTDSHSILARWRKHFSQLFNVHMVSDIRQKYIHTTELLVPEPSVFEVEMAIEKLKRHKLPGIDQIPAEFIKSRVGHFAFRSANLLILYVIRKNRLRSGRSPSLYLFIRRMIKQIVVIIEAHHFCQLRTKCYPTFCSQG